VTPERWHKVTELFHAARTLAPEQRERFLAQACLDDSALRREIEALLAGHDGSDKFADLRASVSNPLAPTASPEASPLLEVRSSVPTKFGDSSALAAWAASTAHSIRACIATSP